MKTRMFKKFKYDKFGVCENPDEHFSYTGNAVKITFLVAEHNTGWHAGHELTYNPDVIDVPIFKTSHMPSRNTGFQNLKDALLDVGQTVLKILRKKEEACLEQDIIFLEDYLIPFGHIKSSNQPLINKAMANKTAQNLPDSGILVQDIPMAQIVASKTNPRKSFDAEAIKDLADSMKPPVGLLQPITIRQVKENKFEIVAGERRYRAAKLLKWSFIPAIIRIISDEEMLEFQILENLQREDVSPLDEAHAFKTLLQKESLEWLASKIHKTKKYILDRLKLNDLAEEGADAVSRGVLPLGHAVLISKLSPEDQQKCLDKCLHGAITHNDQEICEITYEELRDYIETSLMLDFDNVNFDVNDATLLEAAGACSNCTKRTCNSTLLFQDITEDDKCTDPVCFNQKVQAFVTRTKKQLEEKHDKVLAGEKSYSSSEIKVQGVSVPVQKAPTKNSIPVVITKAGNWDRKKLGTVVYIDKNKLEAEKSDKEAKKVSRSSGGNNIGESWQERQARKLKESFPAIEEAIKIAAPHSVIVKEFLRDTIEYWDDRHVIAVAGLLDVIPGVKDPEAVIARDKELEDADNPFQELTELRDGIINKYQGNLEGLIVLHMLVKNCDNDDFDRDRDEEYGFTWKEMKEMLSGTPKPSGKKANGKGVKALLNND